MSATDTIDVVGMLQALQIPFQKRGRELWACCPRHQERTPSWSIYCNPSEWKHGAHKCWGCDFEGGPMWLVMEVLGLSTYRAAREWLTERGLILGASVPADLKIETRVVRLNSSMQEPFGVRIAPLDKWPTPGRRYAVKRGLGNAQLERWGIGCGISGRLACRVYLPTHDADGVLRNYTARSYANKTPKYLDPDAAEHASRTYVFGERFWPTRAQRAAATLVVCEGELNALAFERAGAKYIGALGGSEVDPGQVLRLSSFGRVLVATDLDSAGSKIACALHALCARHLDARRVNFPPKQDACDVEQTDGVQALAELMESAA